MAMTEKRMIRLVNNLQKMADNDKRAHNPYVGLVLLRNNRIFATDAFILHTVEFNGLPYMTFEQERDHWYRVYVEDGRIKFTDDDIMVERINANHGGSVTYENFQKLLEFDGTTSSQWVDPAFMKKALEPYNIAQISVDIKTVEKDRIALVGWNDYVTIHSVVMGIRRK